MADIQLNLKDSSGSPIVAKDVIFNLGQYGIISRKTDENGAVTVPVSLLGNIRIGMVASNTYFSTASLAKYDDTHFYILFNNTLGWAAANVVKICGIRKAKPIVSSGTKYETLPDSYSTEEQLIGTWIDGKPLYQKTVEFTTPSENSFQEYSYLPGIPFSSIDNIISIDGWCKRADGWRVPHLFNLNNALFFSIDWNKSNQKIYFYVFTKSANQPATLTFRYTKITD